MKKYYIPIFLMLINNGLFAQTPQSNTPAKFSCGQQITDGRDGKIYNTVLIGSQCWMAQNLNIGRKIKGANDQPNDSIIEKYCYNDIDSICDIYGGLYQWDELMNYTAISLFNPRSRQGICPAGWHVPSDAEWCQIETYLDPTAGCASIGSRGIDAGGKMKESGTNHWSSPNTGATDAGGLTILPAGARSDGSVFINLGYFAAFWSSSGISSTNAWSRYLEYSNSQVTRAYDLKTYGFSARCVRD